MTKRLKGIPNLPFAPIVAALFGVVAAILVFATPAWLLERTVGTLGISSLISAAQPPLGDTARALIALSTGLATFLALWLIMRPIERLIHKRRTARGFAAPVAAAAAERAVPSVGTRAPIFAGDELGAPFMSDEALAAGEELFLEPAMIEHSDIAPVAGAEPVQSYDPLAFELPPVAARANLVPDPEWPEPVRADPLEINWPQATPEPVAAELEIDEPKGGSIEFVSVSDEAEPIVDLPPVIAPEPVAAESEVEAPTPEPVALNWPVTAPVAEPAPEQTPAPGPVTEAEPSLQDLLRRFESALDTRRVLAAQGAAVAEPPAFGTVASLRDLIESQNKNAA